MEMKTFEIDGKMIGAGESPFIIAEIGANHNGDMVLCRKLIDAAVKCGVDAVKFQSWTKDSLISDAEFKRNTSYNDKKKHFGSLEEMVEKYQLTSEQHREVFDYCSACGVTFLSSAFTCREVEMLEDLGVAAHKIASMDINNLLLLEHIGRTNKPVILSTGMSTLGEIERAIDILKKNGTEQIILLHCISIYPPEYKAINLNNIPMLEQTFGLPVGFSDHTLGTAIPLAAIALGAVMVEKHFTIDKGMEGWDHAISADPEELEVIVREGRNIVLAKGTFQRTVSEAEEKKKHAFRRRIVLCKDKKKNETLKLEDLEFKRPGNGIHPHEYTYVIGRRMIRDMEKGAELDWSDLL